MSKNHSVDTTSVIYYRLTTDETYWGVCSSVYWWRQMRRGQF